MRRQGAHAAKYLRAVVVGQRNAVFLSHHIQGATPDLGEIAVLLQDHRQHRRLQHLAEPLVQDLAVAEHTLEMRRKRTEVQVTWSEKVNGVESHGSSRTVEVQGPTLSDVDIWSLRAELKAMGVDSIVRVRAAEVFARPSRIAALVRVTRADNAEHIASSLCEIEAGTFDSFQEGAERSIRCALARVLR